MLANDLIGLREGLEASLVVSILVAYLVTSGRRHLLSRIWLSVAAAVVLSVGITLGLGLQSLQLDFRTQELIGGTLSIVAAAFVTWMVFWMAGAARTIGSRLRGRVDDAADGRVWSLALVAFIAVGREGLETALILWSNTQAAIGRDLAPSAEQTAAPLLAALAGILPAVALGFLPGLHTLAFDVTAAIPPGSWHGTLLKGVLNFSPVTTVLEALAWTLYVVPVSVLFLRAARRRSAAPAGRPTPAPATPVIEGSTP